MFRTIDPRYKYFNKNKFSLVRNNSTVTNKNLKTSDYSHNISISTSSSSSTTSTMSQNQNGNQEQSITSVKQFGMTPAVSLTEPSLQDVKRTEELCNLLKSYDVFESQEGHMKRLAVLGKLQYLIKEWTVGILTERHHATEAVAVKVCGRIFTFGSFRLGVYQKGSDIDAICVTSRHMRREDFFCSFLGILKQQDEVTECRAIEDAFVPVIKMKFSGIEIDLLFARLSLFYIPHNLYLHNNNLLRHIDPYSVRSLNGVRVTDQILKLVPNIDNFRITLTTIKLWAKKNGIYSNLLGYFGGVTWAVLVARTCQLYPKATVATLVNKFFLVFSKWNWPNPVLLKQPDNVNLNFPVWDPSVNVSDRSHLMPIITPAYPQQNSAFNVTESTKNIIVREFNRGLNITNEIMMGLAQWERLFQAPSFFLRYRHFIVLIVNSQSAKDHLNWCGFIESKLRFLVASLEGNSHISMVHVNPKCFEYKKNNIIVTTSGVQKDISDGMIPITESPYSSMWFLALDVNIGKQKLNLDITKKLQYFYDIVYKQEEKKIMFKKGMNIEARYVRRKHLSQYLNADFLESERQSMKIYLNLNDGKRLATVLTESQDLDQPERPGGVKVQRMDA